MRKLIALLLVGVIGFPSLGLAAERVYEINVASTVSTIHPVHLSLVKILGRIEEKSQGRLQFHIFDNSTLVKADGMFRAVKSGGADIGLLAPAFVAADMPYSFSHDMPFLSSDPLKAGDLMWAMRELPEIQAEFQRANAEPLWAYSSEKLAFGSLHTPIRSMADLRGKRVLVWQPRQSEEVKGWGGIPVQVPMSDTYVALQRGMGEALYAPAPVFASLKLQEIIKYLTIVPSSFTGMWCPINKDRMASLPEDLQRLIREETGMKATREQCEMTRNALLNDFQTIRAAGVEIIELTPEEIAPWKEANIRALTPYWQDILKRGGEKEPDAWIQKVRNLAATVEGGA